MRYRYQALYDNGRVAAGIVEATSERLAYRELSARGLRPTSITATALQRTATRRRLWRGGARDHVAVLKQLSVLIAGGVPVAEAATVLAEGTAHPALVAAYAQLTAGLRRGETFPQAFARCFPDMPNYIHGMITAGDLSGRLAEALGDAATEAEHAVKIRGELRQALVYPVILVVFGLLAVLFIFVVVVPRFAAMFQGKLNELPLLSFLVISFGMWFRQNLALSLVVCASVAVAMTYALKRQSWTEVLGWLSHVPVLRSWLREIEIGRWAAVLARLLENRLPLVPSLELARGILRGRAALAGATQVEREVRAGSTLAEALDRAAFLSAPSLTLIRVGERSGNLAAMVRNIATIYEEAVRNRTRMALSFMEPAAIILIGGVIGLTAVAIFMAITSINNIPGL